ncbi:MAG: DedA family protein [Flavobacteriales bacterium]|nr:DedA family protein [Flavobacteriales bacterium]MBP9079169.1 DedA family protein [Flavobacteriales bacterium]
MELFSGWTDAGLPALFLASFLAATVLPFSSEVLLAAMALGTWGTWPLLFTASIGNTLGGLANYGIGRWLPQGRLLRWFRVDPSTGERWAGQVQRYGAWTAVFCWLPVVGDPIAIALGLFRVRFWPVLVLMFIGKALRYAVVIALLRGLF